MKAILPIAASAAMLAACSPDRKPDAPPSAAATPAPSAAVTASPATTEPGEPARVSQYSKLDHCHEVEFVPDEGGYSRAVCPGLAGYLLELSEGDLRQDIVIATPGGGKHDLAIAEVTHSGGFSRIGDTAEWRGTTGDGGSFRPDALILRYFVVENPEAPEKETSYLLPVSLGGKRPCVAAKLAPGPDQNARARVVADAPMRCLR